eukprot:5646491-Pyramimonas_sp.AAC.1
MGSINLCERGRNKVRILHWTMLSQAFRSSLRASRVDRNSLVRAIYITSVVAGKQPRSIQCSIRAPPPTAHVMHGLVRFSKA